MASVSTERKKEPQEGRERKPHRGPRKLILCRWGRTLASHTGQLYGQELEGIPENCAAVLVHSEKTKGCGAKAGSVRLDTEWLQP